MRKYIIKFSIALIVIILAIFSVYMIYRVYLRANLVAEHEESYTHSIILAQDSIEKSIDKVFFSLSKWENDIPEGFDNYGIVKQDKIEVVTSGVGRTHTLTPNEYQKMVGGYTKEDIVTTFPLEFYQEKYIVFAQKRGEQEYKILFFSPEEFLSGLSLSEKENVLIVQQNGIILASLDEVEATNIFDIVGQTQYQNIQEGESRYLAINKENHFVIKSELSNYDIEIVGYVSGKDIDNMVSRHIRINLMFVGGVSLISFFGAAFILLLYVGINNKNLAGKFSRGKYSITIDRYGNIIYSNKKFKKEGLGHKNITEYITGKNTDITNALNNNGDVMLRIQKGEEEKYIRFLTARSMVGYRMLGTDITPMMKECLEAKELINCHPLTKMPDGKNLQRDYEKAVDSGAGEQFCFLLLEIRDIERYRNMFGHEASDTLSKQFTGRLKGLFEGNIYHIAETRFLVFSKTTETTNYITKYSSKYEAILSSPITIEPHNFKIMFKGGYSKPFNAGYQTDINVYLKQATHALHSAIESEERSIIGFFDAMLKGDSVVLEKRQAIIDLINNDQIMLYYQPQYSLKDGKIIGFEALTRVKKRLNITIAEFIGLAEKNGSIIELGEFVYKKAMDFAKEIKSLRLTISLNISPVQLMQEGFIEKFIQYYRAQNLRKHSIAVEITETYLMTNYAHMSKNLELLHKEGIAVHLDDFGAVYSSMLYLKKLPIDTIKIDREFVKDIVQNDYSKMVVNIIASSSKHLKLNCIAEGVETEEQVNTLKALNCNIIQGYFISAAVPPNEAKKLALEYLEQKRKGKALER